MSKPVAFIAGIGICLTMSVAMAVEKLTLQGLFGNKVVLNIDGKQRVLAKGQTSPEGIRVVDVDRDGAVLSVDGKQKHYGLNTSVSFNFTQTEQQSQKIYRDAGGMFQTIGSINGHTVHFLVDTGASMVSMNSNQARRLGIRYRETGHPSGVSTASGYAKAYQVKLRSVSVGKIRQKNVDALVIDGVHPGPILLGMTFLGRISVEHKGDAMTLTQRKKHH